MPVSDGLICAEFMIEYPANVIGSTVTPHPDFSVVLGDLATGISVCFNNCYYDWVWTHHQQCYITDPELTNIELAPNPDSGAILFANCLHGYPTESVTIVNHLFLNREWIGAEESSWGAIKGMFE